MSSLSTQSTLHAFRTPFLAERPIVAAPRGGTGNPNMSAATTVKRDHPSSQFLPALLRSLSSWAA